MPRYLSLMLVAAFSVVPLTATAQDDASQPKIAPFLTDTAIGFARIRVDRLDFAPIERLAKEYLSDQENQEAVFAEVEKLVSRLQNTRQRFVDAGVTDLYIVVELENVMYGPYLLLEIKERADVAQITKLLQELVKQINLPAVKEYKTLGDFLFAGDQQILENITSGYIAERPHLAEALAAVDSDPLQIIICPSPDQSRAVREAVPAFPAPYQALDGETLSRGIQTAALGVRIEPQPGIRLVIQSEHAESAETLLQAQHQSLDLLAKLAQENMPVAGFDKIVETLKMNRTGKKLALDFQAQGATLQPFVQVLVPFAERQTALARQSEIKNRLHQLGLAMHNWHNVHSVFPAHANYSEGGKPMLSWRVHVLPFLDQMPLYQKFHLNEPWDSEHNKPLISQMPDVFAVPGSAVAKEGKTGYVFPILPDGSAITTGTKDGILIKEITDGVSNTAMIVVADDEHSVIWTKPDDLAIDPKQPLDGLYVDPRGLFQVEMGDGSVRSFPEETDPALWMKILTRAGGEPVVSP